MQAIPQYPDIGILVTWSLGDTVTVWRSLISSRHHTGKDRELGTKKLLPLLLLQFSWSHDAAKNSLSRRRQGRCFLVGLGRLWLDHDEGAQKV